MTNSMKDKRVVLSGPTSGVGKEIALQLAALGAELILACRDVKKGEGVAAQIAAIRGTVKAVVIEMDASSQASIRAFSSEVHHRHDRLDVLINNAACSRGALPKVDSVDGIELTFATNVLGYYLLTHELRDLLLKSAGARVVNVASEFASDLDLDDLQFERRPFESSQAYAQSKACDRLLTWGLARRMQGTGLTANAMSPGLIPETGLFRNAPPGQVKRLKKYSGGRTSAQGADTAVWLSSSPEVSGVSGKFFFDREEHECEFRGQEAEEKLWGICKELAGNK